MESQLAHHLLRGSGCRSRWNRGHDPHHRPSTIDSRSPPVEQRLTERGLQRPSVMVHARGYREAGQVRTYHADQTTIINRIDWVSGIRAPRGALQFVAASVLMCGGPARARDQAGSAQRPALLTSGVHGLLPSGTRAATVALFFALRERNGCLTARVGDGALPSQLNPHRWGKSRCTRQAPHPERPGWIFPYGFLAETRDAWTGVATCKEIEDLVARQRGVPARTRASGHARGRGRLLRRVGPQHARFRLRIRPWRKVSDYRLGRLRLRRSGRANGGCWDRVVGRLEEVRSRARIIAKPSTASRPVPSRRKVPRYQGPGR